MTRFDQAYKKLLFQVYNQGIEEVNERTGKKVKAITGAHFDFKVSSFPLLTLRRIPLKLFVAEQVWYLQGNSNLEFFQKFSSIWDDFKKEDNTVESAYGYRWRNFFGRDQMEGLLTMLEKEPSSRHGVVVTWDPKSDGLASAKKKNVPCVPMWVANLVGGKLNFHVIFRSNDIMLGFPHDVAGFALLQHIIAQKIGKPVGFMHYSVSNAHIYEDHYRQVEELLERYNNHQEIKLVLPERSYERTLEKDETLVEEIYENLKQQYKPLPSLEKMQIAL